MGAAYREGEKKKDYLNNVIQLGVPVGLNYMNYVNTNR